MGNRNISLKEIVSVIEPKESLIASLAIQKPDSTNLQGYEAYSQDKWLTLLTMLNTLKFEPQYYRTVGDQVIHFQQIFHECAMEDPYLTAQCLVYSRCVSDGMRTVTQLGASLLPRYTSGQPWMHTFFSNWNKKASTGGIVFRADDMSRILKFYLATNGSNKLPMSLKKAFKKNLEQLDQYSILKYKNRLIDVINLTHPHPYLSRAARVNIDGNDTPVLSSVMKGLKASADTWEVAQSEAGEIVAQAKREGKVSDDQAQEILRNAKLDNWKGLLKDQKLGMLAALRNVRSILSLNPDNETLEMLILLIKNTVLIREGKIMPFQFDLAIESIKELKPSSQTRMVIEALQVSYEESIPNLKEILSGNNLVMLDCSGSMMQPMASIQAKSKMGTSCFDKAKVVAATIAKATNADVIQFGSRSKFADWNPGENVFTIASSFECSMGGTDLAGAWKFAAKSGRTYDRVFIISDNECNIGKTYKQYSKFIEEVSNPYVYSIDLAGYGSNAIAGPKVRYYFGYGYALFDDLEKNEFNPGFHLDKVRKIIL